MKETQRRSCFDPASVSVSPSPWSHLQGSAPHHSVANKEQVRGGGGSGHRCTTIHQSATMPKTRAMRQSGDKINKKGLTWHGYISGWSSIQKININKQPVKAVFH